MKTPSKKRPYTATADWLATTVFFHLVGLLISANLFGIPRIPRGTATIVFASVILVLFVGAHWYYTWKKNGERIVKECSGITGEKASAVIGGLIALETFAFPITCVILFTLFHR